MQFNNGDLKSVLPPRDHAALQQAATPPPNSAPDFGLLCSLAALVEPGSRPNAANAPNQNTSPPQSQEESFKPIAKSRGRGKTNLDARDAPAKVFPRRKAGQAIRPNAEPVVLSEEVLTSLFDFPLQEACNKLGICATALKKACRRLGIKKWPYKSNTSPVSKPVIEAVDPESTSSNTSVSVHSLLN